MNGFWTCGPFKEVEDRRDRARFRMEQMKRFLDILEHLERIDNQIASGSLEEKYLGLMMKGDVERDLNTILGIENEREETNTEIFGEAILESLTRATEE